MELWHGISEGRLSNMWSYGMELSEGRWSKMWRYGMELPEGR